MGQKQTSRARAVLARTSAHCTLSHCRNLESLYGVIFSIQALLYLTTLEISKHAQTFGRLVHTVYEDPARPVQQRSRAAACRHGRVIVNNALTK